MSLLPLILAALFIIIVVGTAWLIRGIMRPPRKTYAQAIANGNPADPADLQLRGKELTVTLTDQSRSPGWIIAGDQPDGPMIVVVHGFGDSRYGALTWVPLLTPFASRIVLFDLPGHGDSEAKNSQGGMREPIDVLAVIDQVSPNQAVVLFGYSLGAQIAIAAAALDGESDHGPRIAGVIADGPYRFWDQPIVRLLRAKRYPRQPFIFLAGLFLRLTVPGFAQFDRAEKASRMKCPLLILHGTDDELCPYQAAQQIAEAAPNGELITFPGGHHLELAALDPQRYHQALAHFFNGLPKEKQATDHAG